MRASAYTGGGEDLPQASPAPLVHIEDAAEMLAFIQDHMDYYCRWLHTGIAPKGTLGYTKLHVAP